MGVMGNFVSAENAKNYFFSNIYYQKNAEKGARVGLFSEGKFSRFCARGKSIPQFPPISLNFRNVGRGLQFFFDLLDFGEDRGAGGKGFLVFSSRPTSH